MALMDPGALFSQRYSPVALLGNAASLGPDLPTLREWSHKLQLVSRELLPLATAVFAKRSTAESLSVQLCASAKRGCAWRARQLLAIGADPVAEVKPGGRHRLTTALQEACCPGSEAAAFLLLEDPRVTAGLLYWPLLAAAERCCPALVEAMLAKGIEGKPLADAATAACRCSNMPVLQLLAGRIRASDATWPLVAERLTVASLFANFDAGWRWLLENGAPLTNQVLLVACEFSRLDIVRHCLDAGMDANDVKHGMLLTKDTTPLIAACCRSANAAAPVVQLLLERGADPALEVNRRTALSYARMWNKFEAVELLAERVGGHAGDALYCWCARDDVDSVRRVLDDGSHTVEDFTRSWTGYDWWSPFEVACSSGVRVAHLLLDRGAGSSLNEGESFMAFRSSFDRLFASEEGRALLERLLAVCETGWHCDLWPLLRETWDSAAAGWLLERGAGTREQCARRLLQLAQRIIVSEPSSSKQPTEADVQASDACAAVFVEHGVSPCLIHSSGRSLLMLAAMHGQERLVDALLAHGAAAQLGMRDADGETAEMLARHAGHMGIAARLRDAAVGAAAGGSAVEGGGGGGGGADAGAGEPAEALGVSGAGTGAGAS